MPTVTVQSAVATGAIALASVLCAAFIYHRRRRNQLPSEWREVAKLKNIHLYPLKSGHRIELASAECTRYGLIQSSSQKGYQLRDRAFIVVSDQNGEFKTARTFPKMVLIELSAHDEDHVSFEAPGMRQLYVKIPTENAKQQKITHPSMHRNEEIFGLDCGDEAGVWLSRYIYGKDEGLRLLYHDAADEHKRDLTKTHQAMLRQYNELNASTGLYSDLTAVMLLNQASVDDLNTKIATDTIITSEHFRPNLIIEGDGAPPFVEDYWKWIKIGDVILKNVKPCTRCMLTTVDPATGDRNKNREPLKTLETYRKLKDVLNIQFDGELTVMGANMAVYQTGEIKVNDTIYVGI